MIELKNVSFSYFDEPVLKNLNLRLCPGRLYGIVGPNGCGKTTLIRLLSRLRQPEEGELYLEGRAFADFERKEFARNVALLPQTRAVPSISVRHFVSHGRFPHLEMSRRMTKNDEIMVNKALEDTNCAHLARRNMSELSGGERQRAYLAMLLAQDTPYVFLDEPTTYLDISSQFTVMETLQKMRNSGKCVAAVLHDLSMALRFCDELLVMQGGEIVSFGTPAELVEKGVLNEVFGIECESIKLADRIEYIFRPKK